MRYGERASHHRGLRPGHVLKGVTRELGRSGCGLTRKRKVPQTLSIAPLTNLKLSLQNIIDCSIVLQYHYRLFYCITITLSMEVLYGSR